MKQERKTFAINEDFRKSLTHERPEPRNNAPTGRQTRNSAQQSTNAPGRESNSTNNRE
ncbi:MAG: hypothetical protein JSV88_30395 [Candidatus Aminicenantes bacterium]|nr:MAG: hypothetical protein JSV88_30395 [Candidatus Aminicenantes bacterium]